MAKRKNWLLVLVLAIVAALGMCLISACGGTKYAVTWDVSEHATVTVTGFKNLPSEVEEETSLSFIVTPETGYEVSSVSVNGRSVTADKNGNYNAVVKAEMTIKVETVEKVSKVSVKTNPTNLTYYAGQELDPAGMVVEVEYGNGRKANETGYTVSYKNGAAFALGDTSFTVKFKGVESAPVNLAAAVEVKIEIDPVGGTVSNEYVSALQANTELHNVAVAENGVVSFTYSALTANVTLPTAEQWSKGIEDDYKFVSWGGATEVSKDNADSISYKVQYKANLLQLDKIEYVNKTVGEEVVSYLVITGKFKAAKTAYLYLYEGNDKVELVGDTIGDENTERGDDFALEFDLRKLVEKNYVGKWMDIKFCASEGEFTETMEINLEDYPEDFVNLDQVLINGDYSYGFQTYENTLKAVYSNYYKNEYTLTASLNDDGDPILTINGTVYEKWAGKSVCIDLTDCGLEDAVKYGVIGEDGTYSVEFNLKTVNLTTNGYSHFSIVESAENPTVLLKDGDGNLLNAGLITDGLETVNMGLIENKYAVRVPNAKETAVYYVGQGKWGGIVIWGVNEAIATTDVTLKTKDDKPMLAINGTYKDTFTADEVIEYIKQHYAYADLQNNADKGSGSTNEDWGTPTELSWGKAAEGETPAVPATMFVEAADGKWTVYLDLSARVNTIGEVLFSHFGNTSTNLECAKIDKNARITATVGEGEAATQVMYALDDFTAWGGHVVSIKVRTPIDFVKVYTGVKLESADGKAYLVVSGTYTGKAEDGIDELTVDLNTKKNDIAKLDEWTEKKFSQDLKNAQVTVADGIWSIKIDLTSLNLFSGNNVVHWMGGDLDLTIEGLVNAENTVTANIREYKLETQSHWGRDIVVIVVKNNVAGTGADIEVSDDKVLVKVTGTYDKDKVSAENVKSYLYFDIQQNPMADHGDWNCEWIVIKPEIVTITAENGTFTVTYDVTAVENYAYTMHFGRNEKDDFKITEKVDKTVTLGGKNYQIVNFPGSGEAHEYYGCVGLKISDAE